MSSPASISVATAGPSSSRRSQSPSVLARPTGTSATPRESTGDVPARQRAAACAVATAQQPAPAPRRAALRPSDWPVWRCPWTAARSRRLWWSATPSTCDRSRTAAAGRTRSPAESPWRASPAQLSGQPEGEIEPGGHARARDNVVLVHNPLVGDRDSAECLERGKRQPMRGRAPAPEPHEPHLGVRQVSQHLVRADHVQRGNAGVGHECDLRHRCSP